MQAAKILHMPTKSKTKKELTAKQLNDALKFHTHLSESNREIVKLALVDGITYEEVGNDYGVTRARVGYLVKLVYETYVTKVKKLPAGWVVKEIAGPADMIADFEKRAEQALKDYYNS